MFQKTFIIVSIILPMLVGCGGGEENPSDPVTYYFEVSYQNFAWGIQHHGLSIDSNGDVFTFDVSETSDDYPETATEFSESSLTNKFNTSSEFKENVPLSTVREMEAKIASADNGILSDPVGNAADAGIYRYKGFIYNSDEKSYKSVLLHQTGDFKITNSSSEADELKIWLESFAMKYNLYFP